MTAHSLGVAVALLAPSFIAGESAGLHIPYRGALNTSEKYISFDLAIPLLGLYPKDTLTTKENVCARIICCSLVCNCKSYGTA